MLKVRNEIRRDQLRILGPNLSLKISLELVAVTSCWKSTTLISGAVELSDEPTGFGGRTHRADLAETVLTPDLNCFGAMS